MLTTLKRSGRSAMTSRNRRIRGIKHGTHVLGGAPGRTRFLRRTFQMMTTSLTRRIAMNMMPDVSHILWSPQTYRPCPQYSHTTGSIVLSGCSSRNRAACLSLSGGRNLTPLQAAAKFSSCCTLRPSLMFTLLLFTAPTCISLRMPLPQLRSALSISIVLELARSKIWRLQPDFREHKYIKLSSLKCRVAVGRAQSLQGCSVCSARTCEVKHSFAEATLGTALGCGLMHRIRTGLS